ncbi:MAG: aminoglycoside phosphotransferase family protein [Betaproteobacteria bacterium]
MDRYASVQDWIARQFPGKAFTLSPASADASFRRYFRIAFPDATLIVMDAPPPQEDCRPFVRVAALMAAAKVHVPTVLAQDLARGFLLLSDLGSTTYLAALGPSNADQLFGDAIDTLIRWQLASREGVLPVYDETLLRRELDLFPEWYLGRHLGIKLNLQQAEWLEKTFRLIIASNLAQPKVYVHRDYMPRNLMVSVPNPGVLDFQDAVFGPITYDVVSLFKDAFLSWEEQRVLDWTVRYWEKAKRTGLPVDADFGVFYRDFEWMGLQRHLKVLGIFARICHRDGKPGYVEDTPRFLGYVRAVALRYAALTPLLRLLDQFQDREPAVGHSF